MSETTTSQPQHDPLPTPPHIDLLTVPNQIGHAVISPDGSILRREGSISERDVVILHRMMLEVGTVTSGEGVRRVTVGLGETSYVVVIGVDGCLYVVKKKATA